MTAAEAKKKAVWNSIPEVIRSKIQFMVGHGLLYTYMYKSSTPEAFNDIDATLWKLQLLGYRAECDTVDTSDISGDKASITTDTKLTISW